jgi:hypothetical protein
MNEIVSEQIRPRAALRPVLLGCEGDESQLRGNDEARLRTCYCVQLRETCGVQQVGWIEQSRHGRSYARDLWIVESPKAISVERRFSR